MKIEDNKIIPYELVVNEPVVESVTQYELDYTSQVIALIQQTIEVLKNLTAVINAMMGEKR